jgi:hypothetical protein
VGLKFKNISVSRSPAVGYHSGFFGCGREVIFGLKKYQMVVLISDDYHLYTLSCCPIEDT